MHDDQPHARRRVPGRLADVDWPAWQAMLAFALTAASIGLLAADQGGYFPGAWQVATPLFGVGIMATLALARDVLVPRTALLSAAGLAGLVGWTAASWLWSIDRQGTVRDLHFVLVYLTGGAALLLAAAVAGGVPVAAGAAVAVTAVDCFSVVSRLYPGTFGMYNTGGGFGRLYQPIGYWNGLGAFSAIGLVLALGFATRGGFWTRLASAAALVVIAPALYLTFSRGALVGLAAGLVALVALDRHRVQLVVAGAVAATGAAGALLAVHGHAGLTSYYRRQPEQAHQGAQVAARLVSLVPLAMGATAIMAGLEARFTVSRRGRMLAGWALVAAACVALAVGVNRLGNPLTAVHGFLATFNKPAPTFAKGDLNLRFFSLSSNGRVTFWKSGWHDFTGHPVVGSGAGSFHRYWLLHRPAKVVIRNAHSLYLETAAELGVIGLAILLVALLPPLWSGLRRPPHPLAAAITAAYVVFLVHTGGDWTWQLPAVGLAALACAAAVTALDEDAPRIELGGRARVAGIAVAAVVAVLGATGV